MEKFYEIQDVHGVFVDAFVTDQASQMLFGSFWGRDTAIQGLLARLSLPVSEGGLYRLVLQSPDGTGGRTELVVGAEERLTKLTGRMPRANLFGEVSQLWLYDRLSMKPDPATRRAMRLIRANPEETDPKGKLLEQPLTWALFKEVCHLPLLDNWRTTLLETAVQKGWLSFHPGTGVHALILDLGSDEVERTVEVAIQGGHLILEGQGEIQALPFPLPSTEVSESRVFSTDADSKRLTANQLASQLCYFIGTTTWFRHWAVRECTYTEGVEFFAKEGGQNGAFWFIDVVATEFFQLQRRHPFMVIVLAVGESKALIRVEDGHGTLIRDKAIDYTDMQVGEWKFYLTDNVLLLPSEY